MSLDFVEKFSLILLEGMGCSAGLLLAPVESFDQPKKDPINLFLPILGNFWCSVVTLVDFRR